MARVPDIPEEELTPEQRRIAAAISAARHGAVRGPFALWLRLPEVARHANDLGNALRHGGTLDIRLYRLAVLLVARFWSAQYEWYIHARGAREAGLPDETIDAIREKRRPVLTEPAQIAVYDTVTELLETRTLSEPGYRRAEDILGRDALIELVTVAGFFTMAAMVLNAFDAPVPGGEKPLP